MKKALILFCLLTFSYGLQAHPGSLDSNGGHTCRTECAKWGLEQDEYHKHNAGGYVNSKGQQYNNNGELVSTSGVDSAFYLAGKGIITTQSTTAGYRLNDNITRAEVAGIALKLRGTTLPEGYVCKRYFSDTLKNDWICRATELAADEGIVSRTNATFRPQDKITRAEALAIIIKAGGLSDHSPLIDPGMSFIDANSWQSNLLRIAESLKLVDFVKKPNNTGMGGLNMYFYPNRDATRAEVFEFAKNILEYKAMMSGEVNI